MGQKINPIAFRLGISKNWQNRWFFTRSRKVYLEEDVLLRRIIRRKISGSGLDSVEIERVGGGIIKISIKASRPGLIIGRGGKGIEELRKALASAVLKFRLDNKIKEKLDINLNVEELKRTDVSANIIAYNLAQNLEKRLPYRRAMKQAMNEIMHHSEVKGAKIRLAGRLDGAEISRREWLKNGQMPLQNLRAGIDYGEATAFTTYSAIGVKVWIYKGEVFQ